MTRLYKAVLERHEAGLYPAEIARQTGFCASWVIRMLRTNGIEPHSGPLLAGMTENTKPESLAKMASMFRQGLTMAKIGEEFGISRERVRQLLKRQGLTATQGGANKAAASKKSAAGAKRDARSLARYGLSFEEMNKWRKTGLVAAYRNHENSAKARGVEFRLTFAQWIDVWLTSGKLELRGRGKGRYVMSRIKDSGGYVVGNVHIQLATENSLEAVKKWRGKQKANRGVFHMYPGLSTPYLAKVGKLHLGLYSTEEEAVQARIAFIQSNGMSIGSDGTARKAA